MKKSIGFLLRLPVIHTLKWLLRVVSWLFGLAVLAVLAGFLFFTFQVLPNLDHYRSALAQQMGKTLGRQVSIGKLTGVWEGVAPRFELYHLSIANPQGVPLTLDRITVVPSWKSLVVFEPRLALIELSSPSLFVRRGRDNRFYLNGFPLSDTRTGPGPNHSGDWLLRQNRVLITGARIDWQDEYFDLPRLTLSEGRLELTSGLWGHRLLLSGQPPSAVGEHIELTGHWRGDAFAHWQTWRGSLSMQLSGARVSPWSRYFQPFGLLSGGEGDGSIELSFAEGQINRLMADVKVKDAAYTLPGANKLSLPVLSGRLLLERDGDLYQVNATHLSLSSVSGPIFNNSNIHGYWGIGAKGGGELQVDNVNLAHLNPFLRAFGVDRNPLLAHFAPDGQLKNLSMGWQGQFDAPTYYQVKSEFADLAWQPFGQVPGVFGVSGSILLDQNGGRLKLEKALAVAMPSIFSTPLLFSSLVADVNWRTSKEGVEANIDDLRFENADLRGQLAGHYRRGSAHAGMIDLTGQIDRIAAARLAHYLPLQVGTKTIHWITDALKAGTLENTRLRLRGDLQHFPFQGGRGGEFLLSTTLHDTTLLFDKAWPAMEKFDASLVFHNERMDVVSPEVFTLNNRLTKVKASIPDLGAMHPHLALQGTVSGALADILRYTTASPVDGWLSGFLGKTRADGQAALELGLSIPLSGNEHSKVNGQLHLMGNQLTMTSLPLPRLQSVKGVLGITERGVSTNGITFKAFGGDFVLKADSDAEARTRFRIDGQANSRQVATQYVGWLAPHLSGLSRYQIRFALHDGLESLSVSSNLLGTLLNAPVPLAKEAAVALPFNLTLLPTLRGGMRLDFSVGSQIAGRTRFDAAGKAVRTEVAIGRPVSNHLRPGVSVKATLPEIDGQAWQAWVQRATDRTAAAGTPSLSMLHIELASSLLTWGSFRLHKAEVLLDHDPRGEEWHTVINSTEVQGSIDYDPSNNGSIRARLPLVALNKISSLPDSGGVVTSLPTLDISIGKLMYQGSLLGSLVLKAHYVASDWLLDNMTLTMPEGHLNGSIRVLDAGSVEAHFKIQANDVGKILTNFGIKDTFIKGHGSVSGRFSWPGKLMDFDLARASGQMTANLVDGRFAKVDPGVARLLGVLSLQSLPRRIHLDFTDVFSEGFAFDVLQGNATINQGIFKTEKMVMNGPSADVNIKGEINLPTSRQQLLVHVEPHLSEGVALATGAALINPVIGVAALAAQKVLRDPLSKIFAVDYSVSGTLTDPIVTRLTSGSPPSNPSRTPKK